MPLFEVLPIDKLGPLSIAVINMAETKNICFRNLFLNAQLCFNEQLKGFLKSKARFLNFSAGSMYLEYNGFDARSLNSLGNPFHVCKVAVKAGLIDARFFG